MNYREFVLTQSTQKIRAKRGFISSHSKARRRNRHSRAGGNLLYEIIADKVGDAFLQGMPVFTGMTALISGAII
jgi:hypothetical protein